MSAVALADAPEEVAGPIQIQSDQPVRQRVEVDQLIEQPQATKEDESTLSRTIEIPPPIIVSDQSSSRLAPETNDASSTALTLPLTPSTSTNTITVITSPSAAAAAPTSSSNAPTALSTIPAPSPLQRTLRSPGRVFRDPAAVGAFLAAEGQLARIQAAHRAYVDRDRDSEEEEGALEDAFMRGLGGMGQYGGNEQQQQNGSSKSNSKSLGGMKDLKLNRRMLGVLTEDFFGCLRATEREMEMEQDKRDSKASTTESQLLPPPPPFESIHKPGPLTRALAYKRSLQESAEQRRLEAQAKRTAENRKTRIPKGTTHEKEDDDDAEVDGLVNRKALERLREKEMERDSADAPIVDDESTHHRLFLNDCIVPPTITYLKGVPIAWYFTSTIDASVKRKHSRNLHPKKIIECMNSVTYRTPWQSERPIEIVAVFYHTEPHLTPIYMSRERMEAFVTTDASVMRPSGILQKFVPPATEYNSMIRVTWTPSMCLVERRMSGYKLSATRVRLDDRVQTYEVSTGLGQEVKEDIVHESSNLRKVISSTCNNIAEHLAIVHGQTIAGQQSRLSMLNTLQHQQHGCSPVKMTLYFKLAGQHNQLYLLFCDEMKWSKLDMDELEMEVLGHRGLFDSSSSKAEHVVSTHCPGSFAHAGARNKSHYLTSRSDSSDQPEEQKEATSPNLKRSSSNLTTTALTAAPNNKPQQQQLLDPSTITGELTDGLEVFTVKRHLLAARVLPGYKSPNASNATQPSPTADTDGDASQAISSSKPDTTSVAPSVGISLTRKKKGELKCGHCGNVLTMLNSNIHGAGIIITPPPSAANDPNAPTYTFSRAKPYVDLKSVLMYRLSLCAYLLPPAAIKRYDAPQAVADSQKIYSDFFWNLVRPVLLPYYMTDEKEFKIHLYFQKQHEKESYEASILAAAIGPLGPALLNLPPPPSSGYGDPRKNAQKQSGAPISIWDTRIYACKICAHQIRSWNKTKQAAVPATTPQRPSSSKGNTQRSATKPTASGSTLSPPHVKFPNKSPKPSSRTAVYDPDMAYETLDELFELLCESYLGHQLLVPPTALDLALAPHSTGVPAVLSAVPETPGSGTYVSSGGFLRSPNPYMVEQTTLQREAAQVIKNKILETHAAGEAIDEQVIASATADATAKTGGWCPPTAYLSPMSPAAYFARGAAPSTDGPLIPGSPIKSPPTTTSTSLTALQPKSDQTQLDEWSCPEPAERLRIALAQDEYESWKKGEAKLQLLKKYEEDQLEHDKPQPTKKDRELARLERLAEREARKQRAEEGARAYEKWLHEQHELRAAEFAHVRSKLHDPLGGLNDEELRRAREQRRRNRAEEARLVAALLDNGELELDPEARAKANEAILKKLAFLDPIRAEFLRTRVTESPNTTSNTSPTLSPSKKSEHAHSHGHGHHRHRSQSHEDEQREIDRLNGQLHSWYRRQVGREAVVFGKGTGQPVLSTIHGHGQFQGAMMSRNSSRATMQSGLGSIGSDREEGEDTVTVPEFNARIPLSETPTLFGDAPAQPMNHHRRFPSYHAGRVFVSAGASMDDREGLGFSGGRDQPHHTPARVRSAGVARSGSPDAAASSSTFSTPTPGKQARAQSAASRRSPHPSTGTAAATVAASFAPTLVAPTRVGSASAARPRTAGPRPSTATSGGSPTRRLTAEAERQLELEFGYDNARAFAESKSPYQIRDERMRALSGYIPAGWDSRLGESYSTTFGKINSASGIDRAKKKVVSSKKKKDYQRAQIAAAGVNLTPEDSPHVLAARERKRLAKSASEPALQPPASPILPPSQQRLAAKQQQLHSSAGPSKRSSGHGSAHKSSSGSRALGRSSSSLSKLPGRRLGLADELDEADAYDIDDAPIYEDDDEEIHGDRVSESDTKSSKLLTNSSVLDEPSDDLLTRAEAILFQSNVSTTTNKPTSNSHN